MNPGRILVVDDDLNLLEIIRLRLESSQYNVTTVSSWEEAMEAIKETIFNLSIIDLQLSNMSGISLMQNFHQIHPDIPVIILTAFGSIESAVEAMQKGAYTYLTKPFDPRELLFHVDNALEKYQLTTEIRRLKGLLEEKYDFANIIAKSSKMQNVLGQVTYVAQTDSTVYIYGESGTGKELISRAIHLGSNRSNKPFIAVNCAAIPESLLENELFGHEKGAFTGAIQSTKGLFSEAHEGTIFLDEIGDMPLSLQKKILRVLQERQFYPVGGSNPIQVDVRLITATNRNLKEEVKEGRFREDLYYRIHVVPITLPPLRERKDDIPPLVDYLINKLSKQMKKDVKGLTPLAMQRLMSYNWPGNVRELENAIEYAMVMTKKDIITEDLIFDLSGQADEQLKPLKEAKATFERNYLANLLEITRGNISRAAELSGKYRADFYNLMKKYDLKSGDFKKA